MSILIKGMEMPKNDNGKMEPTAVWVYPNGYAIVFNDSGRMQQCTEAIKLPPHGRLTDAMELGKKVDQVERLARQEYQKDGDEYEEGIMDGVHMIAKIISVAPTVIPVDEEDKHEDR